MARLPRLVVPGQAHYVIQRGQSGQAVLAEAADRDLLARLMTQAAQAEQVRLHAFALLDNELQLLCTPVEGLGLSHMMQAVGRRYVSAYNQRRGRAGPLWDGRFRCAVVEPGAALLDVLCLIDGLESTATDPPRTTAGQRAGGRALATVVDPPEYWALGNTPFDREQAYREKLAAGVSVIRAQALRSAALGGWAIGGPLFVSQIAKASGRPVAPRPRGRPRRSAT